MVTTWILFKIEKTLYTSSGSKNCSIEKKLDKVIFDRKHLTRKYILREQAAFKECAKVDVIISPGPIFFYNYFMIFF